MESAHRHIGLVVYVNFGKCRTVEKLNNSTRPPQKRKTGAANHGNLVLFYAYRIALFFLLAAYQKRKRSTLAARFKAIPFGKALRKEICRKCAVLSRAENLAYAHPRLSKRELFHPRKGKRLVIVGEKSENLGRIDINIAKLSAQTDYKLLATHIYLNGFALADCDFYTVNVNGGIRVTSCVKLYRTDISIPPKAVFKVDLTVENVRPLDFKAVAVSLYGNGNIGVCA